MSKLVDSISEIINDTIDKFAEKLANKFNLEKSDILNVLNEISDNIDEPSENTKNTPYTQNIQEVIEQKSDLPNELELQKYGKN